MKNLLLLTAICMGLGAHAQINVGSKAIAAMNKAGKLSDDDISELKSTTTLFVLQWKDYDHIQDFENAIASAWKITRFKIIKPDEMDNYTNKEGYSFFSFGGYYSERSHGPVQGMDKSLFTIHLSYDLWMPHISKKGKFKGPEYYSRTMLSPDADAFKHALQVYRKDFSDKMMQYLYNDAVFNNWGAGFLKGYLETINDLIADGETRGPFTSDEDDDALKRLKRDTLYIPDYVNVHYSPYTGQENDNDKDESDMRSSYPHKIKIITAGQLNDMIRSRSDPFYYLVYVRSASDKFVNVYCNNKGMVFARYTPVSYNFKNKDLAKIDRAMP